MKAKIAIIVLSILLVICIAIIAFIWAIYTKSPHCDSGESFDINDESTWCDPTPNLFDLPTEDDLNKLEKDMSLEDVVKIIGKPLKRDKTAGSFIYIWAFKDIGEVRIKLGRDKIGEDGNGEFLYGYHYITYKKQTM